MYRAWARHRRRSQNLAPNRITVRLRGTSAHLPRYRIDEYIQRGLIDPARRDDL